MNDVEKKCPACFEVHADYTSLPDDDKIVCGICRVKFSPSWHVENSINKVSNSSKSFRSQRKNEKPTETRVKPSALRWLPSAFYVIAILGFAGFVILAIQSENSFLFGYGVGATIACFGSGRLIELVQDINDELYRKRMSE